MIDTANTVLNQAPQALNGVGVNVSFDVDARGMLDSTMPIVQRDSIVTAQIANAIVGTKFVGIDGAARSDMLLNEFSESVAVHFGNCLRNHHPASLHDCHDGSFLGVAAHRASSAAFADSTDVSFVYLDRWPLQLHVVLGEQGANLFEHTPCGFIGDTSFTLNLLCGDAASSGTHQESSIKPQLERGSSFLEDGSGQRINLSAAIIATICGPADDTMMLALNTALIAISDPAGPALLFHVFQAGVIIRKLAVKVSNGVAKCFRNMLFDFNSEGILANGVRVVKGYLPTVLSEIRTTSSPGLILMVGLLIPSEKRGSRKLEATLWYDD
jgi:hypothetical protein